MDDEIPRAIAVDSCRGYIYWTNINTKKPTIERARFDGSEREVVIDSNIYMPVSLAIDQQTKRMYWADDRVGIHYSIESADLNGKNRKEIFVGIHHQPNALTVSKDSIYWVDWGYKSVWQLPKTPSIYAEPKEISIFNGEILPFGIAANYKIRDQIAGSDKCEALRSVPQNKLAITKIFNIPTDAGLFCVHGIKVSGKSLCNCTPGYTGERCDISVCQNYCFQGDCSVSEEQPKCRCYAGYSGKRCEVYACHGYCLNNGECSLNEVDKPVCQCVGTHEGTRCEAVKNDTFTNTPTYYSAERNLTLADLLSSGRKLTAKIYINIEV